MLRYNQAEPPPKVHILQHVRDAHADPKLPEEKKVCEQFVQFNVDRSKGVDTFYPITNSEKENLQKTNKLIHILFSSIFNLSLFLGKGSILNI